MLKVNLLKPVDVARIGSTPRSSAYAVIGSVPSGLWIRPGFGSDPLAVANAVLQSAFPLPDQRVVFQVPDARRLPFDSPTGMALQRFAIQHGITIGRRVATLPWVDELHPGEEAAGRLHEGGTLVVRNEEDVTGMLGAAPSTLRDWVNKDNWPYYSDTRVDVIYRAFSDDIRRGRILPTALRPDTRAFLCSAGWSLLKVAGEWDYPKTRIFNLFRAVHDFAGLDALLPIFDRSDQATQFACYATLERWDALYDEQSATAAVIGDLHRTLDDNPILYTQLAGHVRTFAATRGYDDLVFFHNLQTIAALAQLAPSYDLVIAIAKGGLFSGGIADALGLPVHVVEIHARNRKKQPMRIIDDIRKEDIAGRRILLVDKDTVSGATIREVVRVLAPYAPAAIGCYFHYFPVAQVIHGEPGLPQATIEALERESITIHHPKNVAVPALSPIIDQLHERLATPLGRLRRVLKDLDAAMRPLQETHGEMVRAMRRFAARQERLFHALNPFLPSVDETRRLMVGRLEMYLRYVPKDEPSILHDQALRMVGMMARTDPPLPASSIEALAHGRYLAEGVSDARRRGVENTRIPLSYTAAFGAAREAVRDRYDVAVIVGPEAFAFEPIFRDLGMPTVAVNIPEEDFGGARSIVAFDDLSQLRGKRVLIVEDDVQSGATLRRLLDELLPHAPAAVGLYLGQPLSMQRLENIPTPFSAVYMASDAVAHNEAIFFRHLLQREVVFKYGG